MEPERVFAHSGLVAIRKERECTIMNEKNYFCGLYLRLSNDDARVGESVSIENQRLLLTKYAQDEGWEIKETYIDDGWSGTNMQRPAFQRMMRDAENKHINLVLIKDLSRLGRNHIEVGRLIEDVFPAMNIRFVAINDRIDSLQGEDDMVAYRNLFNEFISKDTSRKVRSVKRSCMERGKYLGTFAPYGYKKDPANKHHLIPDEETAPVVKRIFDMRSQGRSYHDIAVTLSKEHLITPKELYYRRAEKNNPIKVTGLWNSGTVKNILTNEVYIGHMVQGKVGTISYKNHKVVNKPTEQWVKVENTHEPLVEAEKWEAARLLEEKNYKPRKCSDGKQSIFTGLLKCADCGFSMRALSRKGELADGTSYNYFHLICSNYARNGAFACTTHTIRESVLTELLLEEIRTYARIVVCNEQRVINAVTQAKNHESVTHLASYKSELKAAEAALEKLDKGMQTLYDDRIRGIISDNTFKIMASRYERDRDAKNADVQILKSKISKCEREWCDVDAWLKMIRKYTGIEVLTHEILLELIDHVEVSEPTIMNGKKVCHIKVVYRFVGDVGGSLAGLTEGCEADEQAI